ncbi:unnamed protein product, partial [Prunus brigantina]
KKITPSKPRTPRMHWGCFISSLRSLSSEIQASSMSPDRNVGVSSLPRPRCNSQRCFEGKKVSVQKTRRKLTSPTSSAPSLALSSTVASEMRSHIQFHSCFLSFVEKNSSYYAKLFLAVFGG